MKRVVLLKSANVSINYKNIFKIIKRTFLGLLALLLITVLILGLIWYKKDIPAAENEERYLTEHSSFVELTDARLHINKSGTGPVIFLIHGSFASLHTWEIWTAELSKNFTVISMDLPGHGLTGPNENQHYSTDYYADLLWALADRLGIDSVSLAGNSMGGKVAFEMALKQPERVSKLLLINAAGANRWSADSAAKSNNAAKQKRTGFSVFSLLQNSFTANLLTKLTPKFMFEKSLKQVYYDETKIKDGVLQRYYELILHSGNRKATLDRFQSRSPNQFPRLVDLQTPTLIMWGRHDRWIPVAQAHYFDAVLPNSQLVIFENAGHAPMEEIAEESVIVAKSFLLGK